MCTNAPFSRIESVRRVSKTLVAGLAVFLLAAGLVACGGGDDSGSTTAESGGQSEGQSGASTQSDAKGSGSESGSGGDGRSSDSIAGGGQSEGSSASDFVPKQHNDSGGGSGQYQVKGGDNSVQEFGAEADADELDAAAVAVHNFLDARAEGNWVAACEYISKSVIESFEKIAEQAKQIEDKSCAGILEKLINPAAKDAMKAEAARANVGSLRIEGERAFVIYDGIDGTIIAMPMENEAGAWKVASLSGTPLN
jgi:hypothetical protein